MPTNLNASLNARKTELEAELDAINTLLGGSPSRTSNVAPTASRTARTHPRKRMSAAGRRKLSQAAKKRWAAVKRAGKKRL